MSEEELCFGREHVPERIVKFIRRHHVMTLATVSNNTTVSAHVDAAASPLAAVSLHADIPPPTAVDILAGESAGEFFSAPESWCANLFYSYIAEENLFVFTSDEKTRHGAELSAGGLVAASIVLETRNIGLVQGLQLQGYVQRAELHSIITKKARNSYLKRFPYAAAADLTLWVLAPVVMKLTDNRLGFGKKLYWHYNQPQDV